MKPGIALSIVAIAWTFALAVLDARQAAARQSPGAEIDILPVQGFDTTRVYMLVGAGGNIAVQVGEDGVLMVDTGLASRSQAVLTAIRSLTDKPIRYIINTHAHPDHVGGNAAIVQASGGQRTDAGGGNAAAFRQNPNGVIVVAHQNVVDRMFSPGGSESPYPEFAVARSSFVTTDKQLHFNGEAVELWWHPKAHSDGDVLVYFPRSDVVVAGDLVQTATFPRFDRNAGGRLQGMINGLNQIIDLAVPRFNQTGGTRIIPGHGWLSTEPDVVELRDMATIVRDRVQDMVDRKMTLQETKSAQPVADYAPVYAGAPGGWTADEFVEMVYTDLKKPWDGPGPVAKSGLNFIDAGGRPEP